MFVRRLQGTSLHADAREIHWQSKARKKLSASMWQGLQRGAFAQRKVRATGGPAAGRGKGDLPLSAFPSKRVQPLGFKLHQRSGQGNLIIISSPPLAALP